MYAADWEKLSRQEILTFLVIYNSENVPELKYASSGVTEVISGEFTIKKMDSDCIVGILTAGFRIQIKLITHTVCLFLCETHSMRKSQ